MKQLSEDQIKAAWTLLSQGASLDTACTFADDYAVKLLEDWDLLTKQVEELQKALEHYADWVDWEDDDMGKVARTALQSIQGGESK